MDLNLIANGLTQSINPNVEALARISAGYGTAPDGSRAPQYLPDQGVMLQKQALNLVHFDYKRTNTEGVSLLTADVYLREVMQTVEASYQTVATDSAAGPKNQGTTNTVSPTPTQNAAIQGGS